MKEINYKEMKFNPFNLVTMTRRQLSTCALRDIPRSSWMKSRISRSASWINRSRSRWPIWAACQDVTRIR